MIRLRNEAEQILELATGPTITAVTNLAAIVVPFNCDVKAILARSSVANTVSNTVLNLVRLVPGSATRQVIATVTFAFGGTGVIVPAYSAVLAQLVLNKGDVLALDATAVGTVTGAPIVVDVSVSALRHNYPADGLIQTETVLGADADTLF